jgi:hypothetical protein
MAERLNATVLKTVEVHSLREFESHSLRHRAQRSGQGCVISPAIGYWATLVCVAGLVISKNEDGIRFMALSGSLQEISLEESLRYIEQERRAGALIIRRGGLSARIFLDAGQILCTQRSGPGQSLGERLISARLVTPQQLGQVRTSSSDRPIENEVDLARALLQSNYLAREDLRQWVLADAIELLVVLLSWRDGDLVFEERATPTPGKMVIPIPITLVLDEALRHISQHHQQSSPAHVAVTRDLVLDFAQEVGEEEGEVEVSRDHWRFLAAIDGRSSLVEVAQALGISPSLALRLATELLEGNILGVSGLDSHQAERAPFAEQDGPPSASSGRFSRVSGSLPVPGSSGSMSAINRRSTRPPSTER